MLQPWAGKGNRGDKMTKSGACCHHGLVKDTAVTKLTHQWCILSPLAGKGHRGDKNDHKVVHFVNMVW